MKYAFRGALHLAEGVQSSLTTCNHFGGETAVWVCFAEANKTAASSRSNKCLIENTGFFFLRSLIVCKSANSEQEEIGSRSEGFDEYGHNVAQ